MEGVKPQPPIKRSAEELGESRPHKRMRVTSSVLLDYHRVYRESLDQDDTRSYAASQRALSKIYRLRLREEAAKAEIEYRQFLLKRAFPEPPDTKASKRSKSRRPPPLSTSVGTFSTFKAVPPEKAEDAKKREVQRQAEALSKKNELEEELKIRQSLSSYPTACVTPGCGMKTIPFSDRCLAHITMDPNQKLYTNCLYVIRPKKKVGVPQEPRPCTYPVLRHSVPQICAGHIEPYNIENNIRPAKQGKPKKSSEPMSTPRPAAAVLPGTGPTLVVNPTYQMPTLPSTLQQPSLHVSSINRSVPPRPQFSQPPQPQQTFMRPSVPPIPQVPSVSTSGATYQMPKINPPMKFDTTQQQRYATGVSFTSPTPPPVNHFPFPPGFAVKFPKLSTPMAPSPAPVNYSSVNVPPSSSQTSVSLSVPMPMPLPTPQTPPASKPPGDS